MHRLVGVNTFTFVRPDQINLLLLGFSDQKKDRATEKKGKNVIKWEWL